MSTLWHGRFEGGPADDLMAFTVSLPFDRQLAADDLDGSRAHVRGLVRVGLLSDAEGADVLAALDQVATELAEERFMFADTDEDIHTAVERRVTEIAGPAGAKLHTGRSRNDQVATDLRLFTKRSLDRVAERVVALQQVLWSGPPKRVTPTCRATRTCSGPSPCCWPTTCWRTAGRSPATSTAWPTAGAASTCHPSVRARWPGPHCRSIPTAVAADLGFAARVRELARRGQRPRLRRRGALRADA